MNKALNNFFRILFALLMLTISIFATVVSTGLTIYSFSRVTDKIENQIIVGGFFVMMQIMVLLGGLSLGFIFQYCPQHYKFIKTFTYISFVLSVLSTITYFSIIDVTERKEVIENLLYLCPILNGSFKEWLIINLTNLTLLWLSCIVLDLMAMKFPTVGIDLLRKNNIISKVKTEPSMISKLFYILTASIQSNINTMFVKKKYSVEEKERTAKEELKKIKSSTCEKEEPIVKDLSKQEKNDSVDEEDPNDNLENEKDNVIPFKKLDEEGTEQQISFTEKEKDTYLKYIIKNKKKDNSIPTVREVLEATKDKKTINLNAKKITAIRKVLYENNILIEPLDRAKKTYFTEEFLSKLETEKGREISQEYKDLDKQKENELEKCKT